MAHGSIINHDGQDEFWGIGTVWALQDTFFAHSDSIVGVFKDAHRRNLAVNRLSCFVAPTKIEREIVTVTKVGGKWLLSVEQQYIQIHTWLFTTFYDTWWSMGNIRTEQISKGKSKNQEDGKRYIIGKCGQQ